MIINARVLPVSLFSNNVEFVNGDRDQLTAFFCPRVYDNGNYSPQKCRGILLLSHVDVILLWMVLCYLMEPSPFPMKFIWGIMRVRVSVTA